MSDTTQPLQDYILERLDRALDEVAENRRKLDVHLTECSARFQQICFWLRAGTVALFVLFATQFIHLDVAQVIKLFTPALPSL